MAQKLPATEKEIKIQMALGSLPPEMKIGPCRYQAPLVAKGTRTCWLCEETSIKKGDEYYEIWIGQPKYGPAYRNICKDCSWLSKQTIKRMIKENKPKRKQG